MGSVVSANRLFTCSLRAPRHARQKPALFRGAGGAPVPYASVVASSHTKPNSRLRAPTSAAKAAMLIVFIIRLLV